MNHCLDRLLPPHDPVLEEAGIENGWIDGWMDGWMDGLV